MKLLTTRHFTLGKDEGSKVAGNSAQPAFLLEMAGNGIGISWIWMVMVGTGFGIGWSWMGMVGNWKGNNRELVRERLVNSMELFGNGNVKIINGKTE